MQIPSTQASQPQYPLATMVADNRKSMNATYAAETATLKQDRVTLSNDYKSGDKAAIAADKQSISDLEATMKTNRDSLLTVGSDVAQLRGLRKQLETDNKAKDGTASQQDQKAISSMRDQIMTDINANIHS